MIGFIYYSEGVLFFLASLIQLYLFMIFYSVWELYNINLFIVLQQQKNNYQ